MTTLTRRALTLLLTLAVFAPSTASAFCGFYVGGADAKLFNNATQVVMMREGTRTVLSMQNNYQGPPNAFAMVIPVPVVLQKENVKTLPKAVFDHIDQLAAPRLVEYWERDPCYEEPDYLEYEDFGMPDMSMPNVKESAGAEPPPVRIEAQFEVEEYEIVILSADDSGALDDWLKSNNYNIPNGAEPVLRPYVEAGTKFFVAKVDPEKVAFKDGKAVLSPLRFHYDTETFALPIRLGMLNADGAQDLIVHILARGQRYEVANYKNVTIPTNIGVDDEVRENFGGFYAALFDRTLEKNPGAVITEYSWDASTCDPCPGPPLYPEDVTALGAEVLQDTNPWGFVLTRLHARYTSDTLGEDLVFRAAAPILGGREVRGNEGELEHGSTPGGVNNFQGRYIIRHPWTGPIECSKPVFGVWGGPPNGGNSTHAAEDLGDAPRGGVELAYMVRQDVPEIDVKTEAPPIDIKREPDSISCARCTIDTRAAAPPWPVWLVAALLVGVLRRKL